VRELDLLVSASLNWVCGSLDQVGLLIKLVCLIARGHVGLVVFWSLLRSCVFCGIYKKGRNLPTKCEHYVPVQLCWDSPYMCSIAHVHLYIHTGTYTVAWLSVTKMTPVPSFSVPVL